MDFEDLDSINFEDFSSLRSGEPDFEDLSDLDSTDFEDLSDFDSKDFEDFSSLRSPWRCLRLAADARVARRRTDTASRRRNFLEDMLLWYFGEEYVPE